MTALDSRLILPDTIDRFTRAFVARQRRLALSRALAHLVAFCCAWALAWALVDRFFQLPSWARAGVLCGNALVLLIGLIVAPWRVRGRSFAWQDAAAEIERRDPALADRLQTVVTQVSMPGGVRGSDALLSDLAGDVTARLSRQSPDALLPKRTLVPSAIAVAVVLALFAVFATVPFFNLSRLLARQFKPYALIPPVTTTRLTVTPGDIDVAQGSNVIVTARAERLGASDVKLWTGPDAQRLGPQTMPRGLAGAHVIALRDIDRDTTYRVSGGDATSETFLIRVLRKPALRELRVRYTYPAHLDRGPLVQNVTDGLLEAPRGTWAEVSVVATEPMKAADLLLERGGSEFLYVDRFATYSTADPFVRTAWVEINRTAPLRLEMVSDRNVIGAGPDGMRVAAIDDRPPLVQLMREDLRLMPSDVLALPYQAIDDYGVTKLGVRVSRAVSNAEGAGKLLLDAPLPITSDPRLIRDTLTLDLAPYALVFGDVISVAVSATDSLGQTRSSTPCSILIAPRSVEPKTLQRIAALKDAATAAKELIQAPDNAADVQKALLRAIRRADSPAAADHAARLIDATQKLISERGWVFSDKPLDGDQRGITERITRDVTEFYQGEQAKTLLAELENIKAGEQRQADASKPEADALKKSVQRTRSEWEATVKEIGLDPTAGDTPLRLENMARDLDNRLGDESTLDAPQVAREWARRPSGDARTARDRFAVAAQAEVLRPDGDLSWARDLQLASRAIDEQEDVVPTERSARDDVARALDTLRDARPVVKNPDVPVERRQEVEAKAEAARDRLRTLAGEQPALATKPLVANPDTPSAWSESRATDVNEKPASVGPEFWKPRRTPDPAAAARRSADNAQRLMEAKRRQQKLIDRTDAVNAPAQANKLAQDQRQLADAIGGVRQDDAEGLFDSSKKDDSTGKALEAIKVSQQVLAHLPQRIVELRRLAEQARAWEEKRAAAEAASRVAPGNFRTAADRAAAEAGRQAADARARLAEATGRELAATARSVNAAIQQAEQATYATQNTFAGEARSSDADLFNQRALKSAVSDAASNRDAKSTDAASPQAEAEQTVQVSALSASSPNYLQDKPRSAGASSNAPKPSGSSGGSWAAKDSTDAGNTSAPFGTSFDPAAAALAPALAALQRSLTEGDSSAAETSVDAALRAIAKSQASLRATQRQVAQRDPLVAARYFAHQASVALDQKPPDFEAASVYQRETNSALVNVWDTALERGLRARLEKVPGLRSLLSEDYGQPPEVAIDTAAPSDRAWGRLAARASGDVAATAGDVEPAGYEEALRLYFKTLDAARSSDSKR